MSAPAVSGGPDLRPLLAPSSVVVVGASSRLERVAGRPLAFLRDWGFPGPVAAVNPGTSEIAGYPCYPTLDAVPFRPDLAIVCRPAAEVLSSLEQCAARGVGAAVVFASGFAEIEGGCPDEPAIGALARRSGMAVCGPNGLGVINVAARLPATFSNVLAATTLSAGDIGFVSHSGALGIYLYAEAERRGLGFSAWVSTGNEADVCFADVVRQLAADPATRVVCGYLEGVRDGAALRAALQAARAAATPVVVVKGGRSRAGAAAAASHTAAIVGDADIWSGVLGQDGAIEVEDALELLDVASILRLCPRLEPSAGIAIATTSGGGAILFADWCARLGLRLARLAEGTVADLREQIPPFGVATNPVDFTGNLMNDTEMVARVASRLCVDPDVTATVVFVGVAGEMGERVVDGLLAAARPRDALVCVVWIGIPDELRRRLARGGVAVFTDVASCARALARALDWAARAVAADAVKRGPSRAQASRETQSRDDDAPGGRQAAHAGVLAEWQVKERLAEHGLRVPAGRLVRSQASTVLPVAGLPGGGPFAVKGQVVGVAHKAAAGLVRLAVPAVQLADTVEELLAVPRCEGVLVEEMVAPGIEMLVTLRRDPTFGLVAVCGAGGALTELLGDVVARALPLDEEEARGAIAALRIAQRLETRELEEAAAFVASLGRCAAELMVDLDELELNPVTITPDGAVIVDAVGFLRRP